MQARFRHTRSRRRRDEGWIATATLFFTLVAAAAFFFIWPVRASRTLQASEAEAVAVLHAIHEAEFRHLERGDENPTPLTLTSLVETRTPGLDVLRPADTTAPVYSDGTYCYAIYVVGDGGRGILETEARVVESSYWIAYAWPVDHGRGGRRVHAVGPDGVIRFWANPVATYSGPDRLPPPQLAPDGNADDSASFPAQPRTGWHERLAWKVVSDTDSDA